MSKNRAAAAAAPHDTRNKCMLMLLPSIVASERDKSSSFCQRHMLWNEEDRHAWQVPKHVSTWLRQISFWSCLYVLPSPGLILSGKRMHSSLWLPCWLPFPNMLLELTGWDRGMRPSSRSLLSSSNSLNSAASSPRPQGLRSSITRRQMANCGGGGSKCF